MLGDDIGLEVVPEAVRVARAALKAAGAEVKWTNIPIGKAALDRANTTMPKGTLDRLAKLDGFILGPIGHQAYPRNNPEAINPHPIIRRHFDLYANIRPAFRSEEHTSELPSLMRISYAVFCLNKKTLTHIY